ncbi:MAG: hypothetical protein ABH877_04210 [bacterium]
MAMVPPGQMATDGDRVTAAGIAILVLIGAVIIEAAVLGIWTWRRGRKIIELERKICQLGYLAENLKRADELADERRRLDALSDDSFLVDYNSSLTGDPDRDSGEG